MAARLWVAAQLVHDAFRQDEADMWLEQLPTVAATHVDERFIAAFGSRFDVIALRLAEGLEELSAVATCTADELALHMIIGYAEEQRRDGSPAWGWIEALPHHPDDDDFDLLRDILFEDNDVLILYNPAMDGIEDPESDIAQIQRFVNLHPNDWFKTFAK